MKCTAETTVEKCAGILGRGVRSRNGISFPIFWADVADAVSTPSTLALRTLIQLNPKIYAKYIHLLAQSLPEIHSSSAKAEIIWLVGEYASQLGGRAPDVLRLALQDFADQVIIPHKAYLNQGRRRQISDYYTGGKSTYVMLSGSAYRRRYPGSTTKTDSFAL